MEHQDIYVQHLMVMRTKSERDYHHMWGNKTLDLKDIHLVENVVEVEL